MPKWLKIVLIVVGVLILLGIVAIVVAVYYGRQVYQTNTTAGQEYGQKTDSAGCVSETIARYKPDRGIGKAIGLKFFLTGCLHASRPTPDFCRNVPRATDFSETGRWSLERCRAADLVDDQGCPQIFTGIIEYCEQGGRSRSDSPTPTPPN
jgi:hypothetical protein